MTESKPFRVVLTVVDTVFLIPTMLIVFYVCAALVVVSGLAAFKTIIDHLEFNVFPFIGRHPIFCVTSVIAAFWTLVRWHKFGGKPDHRGLSSWH
jgi:hypothetical protein